MIRGRATTDAGRPMIILGLEEGNVDRLRLGQPIHFHADELGFEGEILILLGNDCDDLRQKLGELITAETHVVDNRKRAKQ